MGLEEDETNNFFPGIARILVPVTPKRCLGQFSMINVHELGSSKLTNTETARDEIDN